MRCVPDVSVMLRESGPSKYIGLFLNTKSRITIMPPGITAMAVIYECLV